MVYCSHLQILSMPVGYEELAGGFHPVKNCEIFGMNNNTSYAILSSSYYEISHEWLDFRHHTYNF